MKEKILPPILKFGNFILNDLPFIVIFTSCLAFNTLKDSLFNWGGGASNLKYYSVAFLLSVILSCVSRKHKIIKALFYLIAIAIFAVNMFLWKVFGTSISPLIFQLIAETNGRESTEFINAFAFSRGAFITYIYGVFY